MFHVLRSALPFACVFAFGSACFIENPNAVSQTDAAVATPVDAGASVDSGAVVVDAGPSLCEKYGGYPTVEKVVADLFGALVADCRINRFFTTLTTPRQGHLYDCLVKQVAVVMQCPGIRYDVDNSGVACRDMKTSHLGLAIRGADFDALVQDLVNVLVKDGVSQADIEAMAPTLLSLRSDIVTNSAPGYAKPICDGGQ